MIGKVLEDNEILLYTTDRFYLWLYWNRRNIWLLETPMVDWYLLPPSRKYSY
jgi:hypothetical protein